MQFLPMVQRTVKAVKKSVTLEGTKRIRKMFYEPFKGHETNRRCAECPRHASAWRFIEDDFGGKDKSSKRPVCSSHAPGL